MYSAYVVASTAPRLNRIDFGGGAAVDVEEEYYAEEGSVVWDASRSLLAHVTHSRKAADLVMDKRLLEIGAGTGVVGLALAQYLRGSGCTRGWAFAMADAAPQPQQQPQPQPQQPQPQQSTRSALRSHANAPCSPPPCQRC